MQNEELLVLPALKIPDWLVEELLKVHHWSERDALLNSPARCSYCDLIIFSQEPCEMLVPDGAPLSGKHMKGLVFHANRICLNKFKALMDEAGIRFYGI